ncbi:hypothetical protein TNCV_636881 [Trichonephila clavipes]|nr:hypothetical protein TNCV_636881 [Trichonephila clavipes]
MQSGLSRVLCMAESSIQFRVCHQTCIAMRDSETRNNSIIVKARSHFKQEDLRVLVGISIDGRTDRHIIRNGNLRAQRYADEILKCNAAP